MTVTPSDLIDFADRLAPDSEVASRAGVSRAYYGVYHAAQEFHTSLPSGGVVSNPTEGAHSKLYQSLLAPTIKKDDPRHTVSRRVGAMGRHLHGLRISADYELTRTVSDEVRKQSVLEARKIIQIIQSA